jgi:hypothetical protein
MMRIWHGILRTGRGLMSTWRGPFRFGRGQTRTHADCTRADADQWGPTRTVRTRRGKDAERTREFWRLFTKFSSLTQVRDIWTAKSHTDKTHFSVYMYVINYNGQCPLHSTWARRSQMRTNSSTQTVRGQTRCRGLSRVQEARGGLLVNLVAH